MKRPRPGALQIATYRDGRVTSSVTYPLLENSPTGRYVAVTRGTRSLIFAVEEIADLILCIRNGADRFAPDMFGEKKS